MYTYKAKVTKIYDGDTITVDFDLGFGIKYQNQKIRLANINTPEVRGEEREAGLISRDVLREKILDKEVIITTFRDKKGKYGRYIGIVYLEEEIYDATLLTEDNKITTLVNINDWLVTEGYAVKAEY
ncbi:MAG: thermonuclease family protein [Promethearchaeota archaeon]|jgi:micrococcal nuclease